MLSVRAALSYLVAFQAEAELVADLRMSPLAARKVLQLRAEYEAPWVLSVRQL